MGGLIFVFVMLVIIIGGIFLKIDHDEWHPKKTVTPGIVGDPWDVTESPYYCKIHRLYFASMGTTCPKCWGEYERDKAKHIDAGTQGPYLFKDWLALRKIDFALQEGEITEQEATRKHNAYIQTMQQRNG